MYFDFSGLNIYIFNHLNGRLYNLVHFFCRNRRYLQPEALLMRERISSQITV